MADIKKELNDIKNAVYGKEVRGAIHDGIKKINEEVEDATELSENAKYQVENIQQQVNQLVVEGDSSVEAAQARVDADGNTFTTLKERLDTKETQFASQLAQKVDEKDVFIQDFSNLTELHLEDFSGYNQPFHPSVIYIPEGFQGYKYWLTQSPYPHNAQPYRERWEVPIVYKSNDGINWIVVANPLDDLTGEEIERRDYMSDPHILYREDLNRLEVWYRHTINDGSSLPTAILRKTTTDGENWSDRETLIPYKSHLEIDFMRSPSILWDNGNKRYRAWYTNTQGNWYNTSPNGKDWGNQQRLNHNIPHGTWHIDVNYYNGEYHLLSQASSLTSTTGTSNLAYYTSNNGIDFNYIQIILDSNSSNELFSGGVYRACSLLDENGDVRLYTSAWKENRKATVLMGIGSNLSDMFPIKENINGNIVEIDGNKLQDTVRVFPKDEFNGESEYTEFPPNVITQNMVSLDNTDGLPVNREGLLVTDRTAMKSNHANDTFSTQFYYERPRSGRPRIFYRTTGKNTPIGWDEWIELSHQAEDTVRVFPRDEFNGDNVYTDFPEGVISQNLVSFGNTSGLPVDRGGLLVTDRTAMKSDGQSSETFTTQTYYERPSSQGTRIYYRTSGRTDPQIWEPWMRIVMEPV